MIHRTPIDRIHILILWLMAGWLFAMPVAASQPGLADRVVEHRLANGMKVLMVERKQVPIISLNMTYRVGSMHERTGMTGVAHLFEHMAFKGTQTLGTRDFEEEKEVLEELERVHAVLRRATSTKGAVPAGRQAVDAETIRRLRDRFRDLEQKAQQFVVSNEIGEIYSKHGGVGFNAGTSRDYTRYTISLPANRLPLWAAIESDRMVHTVLREFYKEKEVVLEERQLRVDNQPSGMLYEAFLATAFQAHPYGLPTIGWESDIASLSPEETRAFFEAFYTPHNAVLAIVGDLEPMETIALMDRAFGSVQGRPSPVHHITQEPDQNGERRVEVRFDANPQVLIGYHIPSIGTQDYFALEVINAVLSQGRSSRLYKRLVKEKKIAVGVFSNTGVPGARDPNLFIAGGMPRAPHTARELEEAIYAELERLKGEPVQQRELTRILNQLDASLIRSLSTNSGLAAQLAYYEAVAGDWRFLLRARDQISAVTAEDVMQAATKYFTKANRTVATLVDRRQGDDR